MSRILLAEDSKTQAEAITASLTQHGVDVMVAPNGTIALQMITANPLPDLVILDVNMPEMNGFQVCHRLKRDPRTCHIPVIILTSEDSAQSTLQGLEAGADDYIPKDDFAGAILIDTLRLFKLVEAI